MKRADPRSAPDHPALTGNPETLPRTRRLAGVWSDGKR